KTVFEYGWFYLMTVVLCGAALVGAVWIYIDQKTEAMEKKQAEAVEKERLNTELQTASRIQNSMMPHIFPPFPDRDEFDIYAVMKPAREVGGDFYDFFMIDSDHLCMVMADVSGKGIPAALFMMVSKAIVKNSAMLVNSPSEVLVKTNEVICSDNTVDMFVTIWLGVLELSTGKMKASNAGHEYPVVMKNGRFELLKDKHGLVVGAMEDAVYTDYELTLEPGDKLFVYTDGVPEATDEENNMFGTDRMIDALNVDPASEPHQILENVQQAVNDFVKEAEQFDDLTMMCFAYKGKKTA
ncbi:MAG: PP2C family protein-serine/threonine phosphatase, partial [Erysipelotrichaceae bacterium]|nr:PP2C family protein-serine/threonine phosphatase [Erysipelotrichaceae bacterium]